ncbi:uncharacterized protein LOC131643763 [Vicia villosa]|uniref:uncharacterized protein LOC131643763 n=1 Tax=Vicia villosa TaxID=3911 RepID=UPI00273BC6F5|nr:uncharacterized protein LOC131643763 [Vicia villosa]
MATTNIVQEKHNQHEKSQSQQEEDETLSLCDLPLPLNNTCKEQHSQINETTHEEFNFRSWVGLFSTEPEMCVADEIFFQGQILPLSRLSFSSEAGFSSNDHGVVPTPEIGLQDLKVRSSNHRNCVSRNSSSSSNSNSTKSVKMSEKKNDDGGKSNHVLKRLVGKRGGLLSGCDCSFETVVINGSGVKSGYKTESTTKHAGKEKVMEWKKQKQRQKQGKKVMSRRRTFEWLRELHANHLDEEALLANSS